MRTITFSLNPDSIKKAIRELEQYIVDFDDACHELTRRLTEEGVQIAKMQVVSLGAFDTGELEASIKGYYSPGLRTGFIVAGAPYAVFVEYGTGVVGKAGQHPQPDGWAYDVNNHGDSGWVYKSDRDGKFHWTKGMPSRPFMYNTLRELERKAENIAREVFGKL